MPATSPPTITIHANSFPDFTGEKVHGRYELVELLGTGTFGVVYKAIDHRSDCRFVAVKIMRKAGRSEAELAVIEREVILHDAVSTIKGVVDLIDAFDDDKWCYMILEFCPGGDLFGQIVDKECYYGKDQLLRQAYISLIDAVQACHDAEIAHRDLKPENILTSKDGSELYLADFGLAANAKMVGDFGSGTHIYMSPECIGETTGMQPYDPFLSDIWALGIILVNMISASHPWMQATTSDAQYRQFLKDPDFLYKSFPMSTEAHTIIRATLQLHPTERISLHDLREAILSLETFFRPMSGIRYGYCAAQSAQPTATPGCWESLFATRPKSVPGPTPLEILLPRSASTQAIRHRSVDSIFDTPSTSTAPQSRCDTPALTSCLCLWSCCSGSGSGSGMGSTSTSRASSDVSSEEEEELITPDGSAGVATVPSKLEMWEQMMMEAFQEEAREEHVDWRKSSSRRTLLLRSRARSY